MPHTTSAQRVAGLRGRLYEAQNKYQARLREADALERQLLMIAAERAKTEALLLARQLAAARSPKLSLSRRDHEREASVLAAAAAKASTHLARLACDMATVDEELALDLRLLRGRWAAVEAAQWSCRAVGGSESAVWWDVHGRSHCPPECAFDLLLHESDERGLPATMLVVLDLGLRTSLSGLLALAATSRGLRRAVDAHVSDRQVGINSGERASCNGRELSARCACRSSIHGPNSNQLALALVPAPAPALALALAQA